MNLPLEHPPETYMHPQNSWSEGLTMKNPILSVVWHLRRFPLRRVFSCLVAASLCWGAAAQAQEKVPDAPHAAGWVVIPVEEYRVLRAKAYPVEHDPEPPPVEATLTRVDYDLRIPGDLATGRASLTVDVLKDGWVRVPVPAGLLVREARLDGKPGSRLCLRRREKAGHTWRRCCHMPGATCCCSMWMCLSVRLRAMRVFLYPRPNRA